MNSSPKFKVFIHNFISLFYYGEILTKSICFIMGIFHHLVKISPRFGEFPPSLFILYGDISPGFGDTLTNLPAAFSWLVLHSTQITT